MKKVLIVDDEMISLMTTDNILSSAYETACASSGQEAISLYEEVHPDMVLSDLRMPRMSGFELKRTLEERCHEVVPFMFMTADNDSETENRGFQSGATDFIHKPFNPDVLLRRVENILKSAEKLHKLSQAATRDPMTGLLNKASAQNEIGEMCQIISGAFMMVDLDSFKPVNDIYGHAMGDKILIRFSEILRSVVRSADLIGRMGGDEFVMFCQNVDSREIIAEKSRIINELTVQSAKEMMGEDMSIPIGASIGCALAPKDGMDFLSLYKKADKALYSVKQNAKHGFALFGDLESQTEEKENTTNSFSDLLMLLNERNISNGAIVLSSEEFRSSFRLMKRLAINNMLPACLLLFTMTSEVGKNRSTNFENIDMEFMNVLTASLRQSDAVSKNSRTQFFALLPNVEENEAEPIARRVIEEWYKTKSGEHFTITYEYESLGK